MAWVECKGIRHGKNPPDNGGERGNGDNKKPLAARLGAKGAKGGEVKTRERAG